MSDGGGSPRTYPPGFTQGTVTRKLHGCVIVDGDVFVHRQAYCGADIARLWIDTLKEGDSVEMVVEAHVHGRNNWRAVKVRAVGDAVDNLAEAQQRDKQQHEQYQQLQVQQPSSPKPRRASEDRRRSPSFPRFSQNSQHHLFTPPSRHRSLSPHRPANGAQRGNPGPCGVHSPKEQRRQGHNRSQSLTMPQAVLLAMQGGDGGMLGGGMLGGGMGGGLSGGLSDRQRRAKAGRSLPVGSDMSSLLVDMDAPDREWKQTDRLSGRVNATLNKLTRANFDRLSADLCALHYKDADALHLVSRRIFEKAVSEPSFSALYADLCVTLAASLPTPVDSHGDITEFRRVLLQCCQNEFQAMVEGGGDGEAKQRQWLGNVNFIGSLFQKRLLSASVLHYCMTSLLSPSPPNPLLVESACKLLTNVGKDLAASRPSQVHEYVSTLSSLYNPPSSSPSPALPTRVRFMIQDVLELEQRGWDTPPSAVETTPHQHPHAHSAPPSAKHGGGGGGGGAPLVSPRRGRRGRVGETARQRSFHDSGFSPSRARIDKSHSMHERRTPSFPLTTHPASPSSTPSAGPPPPPLSLRSPSTSPFPSPPSSPMPSPPSTPRGSIASLSFTPLPLASLPRLSGAALDVRRAQFRALLLAFVAHQQLESTIAQVTSSPPFHAWQVHMLCEWFVTGFERSEVERRRLCELVLALHRADVVTRVQVRDAWALVCSQLPEIEEDIPKATEHLPAMFTHGLFHGYLDLDALLQCLLPLRPSGQALDIFLVTLQHLNSLLTNVALLDLCSRAKFDVADVAPRNLSDEEFRARLEELKLGFLISANQ